MRQFINLGGRLEALAVFRPGPLSRLGEQARRPRQSYVKIVYPEEQEEAVARGDDADLKEWAGKTLPTLQHHLDIAQELGKVPSVGQSSK